MVVARGWGAGVMGSYGLMSIKCEFCKMKRVLGIKGGSDYTR